MLLLAALVFFDMSRTLGNPVYDMLLNWHRFQPSKDIVIVTIDDRSLDALGGWPLSRKHYADLLALWDNPRCKPQSIGIDLLFLDASPEDAELAEKMAAHKVVLPLEFRWDSHLTDSIEGFGIGLNFVENVLRKHFGTIQRHIPKTGIATVTLRLPCNLQN